MISKAIFLFLLICLLSSFFSIGCTPLENQTPLKEAAPLKEDNQPTESDGQLRKETALPEKPKSEITEPQTPQNQANFVNEYQNAAQRFVNTIAGILADADIPLTEENIRELEQIILILQQAQESIDYNTAPGLDELSEVPERLESLCETLHIEPLEFSELRVSAPARIGEKYVIISGIWLREARLALRDLGRHKENGANCILVTVPLDCDSLLNFSTPSQEALAMYVQAAHASGMSVLLSPCQGPPAGYSRGWHEAFFGEKKELSGKDVLDALTPFVIEWAEFAEKYEVEIFMPVIEPIMWASMDTRYWEMDDQTAGEICDIVTEWMHEILPMMGERYSGELMFATHNRVVGNSPFFKLDFSGYDYIADWEAGEDLVTELSQECEATDSCRGLIHHITLYVGGLDFEPAYTLTEEEQATAYNEFFRQTWNHEMTAGIMLDQGVGKEYFGKPAERVIESWLADTDKVATSLFEILDKILSPSEITYSEEWLHPPTPH